METLTNKRIKTMVIKDKGHNTLESVIPADKVDDVKELRLQAQNGIDWASNYIKNNIDPISDVDGFLAFAYEIFEFVNYYFGKQSEIIFSDQQFNIPTDKPAGFYLGAGMLINESHVNGDFTGITLSSFESNFRSSWNIFSEYTMFYSVLPSAKYWIQAHKIFCSTPRGAVVNNLSLEKMGCKQELSIMFLYFLIMLKRNNFSLKAPNKIKNLDAFMKC